MKSLFRVSAMLLAIAFLALGCGKNNPLAPSDPTDDGAQYQRPEFIDNRPEEVKQAFTLIHAEPVKLDESTPKGDKYALVIGISDYSGTANDLQYCDDDATDWKARLEKEGYTVTILLDLNATKSAIESAINTLASRAIAGNEIAFCYSGHGSKGNIISTDLYYISSRWFKTKFSTAKSAKMMFAFDACQIGAMSTNLNATGRVIAVASDTRTYSYDGNSTMKNGVFTYYQIKAFDELGYIYYEPDCKYACDQMKIWASQYPRIKVAPSYTDSYAGDLNL